MRDRDEHGGGAKRERAEATFLVVAFIAYSLVMGFLVSTVCKRLAHPEPWEIRQSTAGPCTP